MGRSARKPHRTGSARSQQVLQRHLVRLWQTLAATRRPPAIDRFLARELSRLDGLPRQDRLWLGDLLTDALRFGSLTLFAETWRRDGWQPEVSLADRLAECPPPAGEELWRRLGRLPAPIVFFWTFMRKRLTGAALPAIAPPGPQAAEVWRSLRKQAPTATAPEVRALWSGLPPALMPLIAARAAASRWTPSRTLEFLDRHAVRPPVWLRLLQPAAHKRLAQDLAAGGFAVTRHGSAWAVSGPRSIHELASYRAGLCEIQDLASQGIGDAVDARPGEWIWDCCAGAGGKSVQLAALVGRRGRVHATDLHARKLQDLDRRARRAGLENIGAQIWDGAALPAFGDDAEEIRRRGGFDAVLVDAPCSGSGTWRRNVDGRLRLDPGQPGPWAAVQSRLLALVAPAVRPGGRLVYATCSWLTAENEAVCAAFVATHPDWRCRRARLVGNPDADSDTTFHAIFERTA